MKNQTILLMSIFSMISATGCKVSNSSSTMNTGAEQSISNSDQPYVVTQADLQEFYEIVKEFYLIRANSSQFTDNGHFEITMLRKFSIPLDSNDKIYTFSKNMFDFMESGNYSVILHGVPRKAQISALPLKGMTNRDLEDFLQVVKTEYFKYIASVRVQSIGAREMRFYARIQGLKSTELPRQGELLINAGDLFTKIETGK